MDKVSYEEIGGDSQEDRQRSNQSLCVWANMASNYGTPGSKAEVLYGAHKERESRARAGAAAKGDSSQGVSRGRWRRDSRKKWAQASGARDGPSAGVVVVEARSGAGEVVVEAREVGLEAVAQKGGAVAEEGLAD